MRTLRAAVARMRGVLRTAAVRLAGLPHTEGTVDSPPPDVAGDITKLWLRNSNPFSRARVSHPDGGADVTMTTHGERLRDVWLAVESIGRGTVKPRRLILWLDDPAARLPRRLRRLRRRGLEVLRTDPGLGVHTKYWPYLATQPLEVPLVLGDDDIVYPPTWLEGLLAAQAQSPDCAVAYRVHTVGFAADGGFAPYAQWRSCESDQPSYAHFATSVSGQLLPVEFQRALRAEGTAFRSLAPTADDVWLHRTAVLSGFRTRQVAPGQQHWWFIPGSQTTGLNAVNVVGGANDRQLRASHTRLTRERIRGDL